MGTVSFAPDQVRWGQKAHNNWVVAQKPFLLDLRLEMRKKGKELVL